MSVETLNLSDQDIAQLELAKMTREVREKVRTALQGSNVHPVAMDFGLAHPVLHALGLGHDGSYKLMLALNKGDRLTEEQLIILDRALLEWGKVKVLPTITKEAGWRDQLNGYIQRHGSGGNL